MALNDDDLREWAFTVPIESTRQIGADRMRLVLLRLVEYAAGDGTAYPSAATIASRLFGMTRRDVRNAFDGLSEQRVIERLPSFRKSVTWRVLADVAGTPASSDVAGDVAGHVAGDLAGMPATNRTELKSPRKPPRGGRRTRADQILDHAAARMRAVEAYQEATGERFDVWRLRGQPPHVEADFVAAWDPQSRNANVIDVEVIEVNDP